MGIKKDLLLVSVSALIGVLVAQYFQPEKLILQNQTEGSVAIIDEVVPQTDNSIGDQLAALRMEMEKEG